MQPKIDYQNPKGSWGRNGDKYMAHIQPGETIVPPVISPELRARLYEEMRAAGIPVEEYVVGEGMSINPVTGHPEFGFGKVFKKITKAITSIPIVGPVILPAAAAALGAGPLGTALVSGAQTKLSGGSWGQAIGAAAGSYIGGQVGGPGTGTIGSTAAEAGFTGISDIIGNTLASTPISTVTGSLLGTSLGSAAGAYIDPPKAPSQSWGNEMANLPSFNVTGGSTGGVAVPGQTDPNLPKGPSAEELALSAQRGAGITVGSPTGVNYQQTVIDRDTGRPRTINTSFSNNYDRRNAWGSGVSFA